MDLDLELWQGRFQEYQELRSSSPRTVATYTAELKPFFGFLRAQGVKSLGALTRELIEDYRTHLFYLRFRGKTLALSSQRVRLQAVKCFLRFLQRKRYLLLDYGSSVELPKAPRTLPRVILTEPEILELLRAPDLTTPAGVRDRTILEVLYGTAIRNSELRDLRLDEADLVRKELRIENGKGNKSRVLPLGDEAAAWLEEYLARVRPILLRSSDEQLVFLTMRGTPFTRTELAELVQRQAKTAGLTKKVNPHSLRHTCATHMLRHGAGLRHLQQMLGHSSPETTQRYTQVEISDLRKVVEKCHPRERKTR
jgi:integrase/recombinase XerD